MTFRLSVITSAIVVASALTASVADAECIRLPVQRLLDNTAHELVFKGTVVKITRTGDDGYWATFNVDRVWKGSVSRRFGVYVWWVAPGRDHFELLHDYSVFAQRLIDLRARKGAGVGEADTIAFIQAQCTDQALLGPNIMRDLGRGRPPD